MNLLQITTAPDISTADREAVQIAYYLVSQAGPNAGADAVLAAFQSLRWCADHCISISEAMRTELRSRQIEYYTRFTQARPNSGALALSLTGGDVSPPDNSRVRGFDAALIPEPTLDGERCSYADPVHGLLETR